MGTGRQSRDHADRRLRCSTTTPTPTPIPDPGRRPATRSCHAGAAARRPLARTRGTTAGDDATRPSRARRPCGMRTVLAASFLSAVLAAGGTAALVRRSARAGRGAPAASTSRAP